MENLVENQENRGLAAAAGGGGRVRSKAAAGGFAAAVSSRPALGEICQNTRRQQQSRNNLPVKNQGTFSIFCDEPVPDKVGAGGRGGLAPTKDATLDKENLAPSTKIRVGKAVQGERGLKVVEELRAGQSRLVQLNTQPEPMNVSVCEESPMVVVEPEEVVKEQWRVPPIKDNQTVDIFTEPEYFQDIYQYLKESEVKHLPKANYMAKQSDITHSMRSILVDWLVEVGEEYKLQTETLNLAINYIDRFLSYMAVQRSKLQLVGAACMFIAAKYEEIYPPDVSEFVYITDDTYTKRQVLRMEHLVLKVLSFDLSVPTTFLFINKMVTMDKEMLGEEESEKVAALASYLNELALVEGEQFLRYQPSLVAACCVALARHTLQVDEVWSDYMEERTGYQLDEMKECFVALHTTFSNAPEHPQQAVREKYKATKHFGVSELTPSAVI